MTEYTDAYVRFMLECKGAFDDLCEKIDAGDVLAHQSARVVVTIPASVVDQVRFDRIAAAAEAS
jgi:hypothetical protein